MPHDERQLRNPICIFPLPATVFYPKTSLPLHIFEPRYREMTQDALDGGKLIGMVLLKSGWEAGYYGKPGIEDVGCAGKISRAQRLPDGKYNITLHGLSRFRIVDEIDGKPYRLANVDFLPEVNDTPLTGQSNPRCGELLTRYLHYLQLLPESHKDRKNLEPLDERQSLSSLVDQLAHRFDFKLRQKQSLLEETDVNKRLEIILATLALKIQIINMSRSRNPVGADARMN